MEETEGEKKEELLSEEALSDDLDLQKDLEDLPV